MTTRISPTSNFRRRGFTFAELMLVVVLLALLAGFTGTYYAGTYRKTELRSAAGTLLLTGKYARMRAIECGQTCRLYVDNAGRQFYLMAPVYDAGRQTKTQSVVSNPYCRRETLKNGIAFEYVDVEPALGESEIEQDGKNCIHFYPDGCCDAAVVQIGDGRHSMTAVFSSAYAKIRIYEGTKEMVENQMQVVDLDAVD